MKILFGVSSTKNFHIEEFSKFLNQFEITTKVVSDIEYADGYPSRRIKNWIKNSKKFRKLVSEFKPDLIFVDRQRHFGLESLRNNIPLITHLRGDFWEEMKMAENTLYKSFPKKIALKKWQKIANENFENSSIILPICNYLKIKTKEKYPEHNIQVLYQGINPENWFDESGIKLKHPCVGIIQSANIWEKTQEMLVLCDIMEKFPNVTFYWVGDGPYANKILPKLKKFKNFKSLGTLEYPEKIRQFLTEIDIYALISGIDMAPLSLLEAQLMKKPVIATNIGGVPELMIDNESGFLVEKGNPESYIDKLKMLLDDNHLQKIMGEKGRIFVDDKFNWKKIVNDFIIILKDYGFDVHNRNKD